ncbi:MAG TPA: hypothetical protein VEY11_19740 [Pyrinomonadaceae bacterium]|nr:hypothetical protein [Pyrinomonadaceae bacterium]
MNKTDANNELVETVRDLTRVLLALSEKYESKSETIRDLNSYAIPPSRIASLLGMPLKDVTSILSRAKKSSGKAK